MDYSGVDDEISSLVDEIAERISELREDDYEPTSVQASPELYRSLRENLPKKEFEKVLAVDVYPNNVVSDLERDYLVTYEDGIEDSTLSLPSPDVIQEEIVDKLELDRVEDEELDKDSYGFKVSVFAEVEKKGVEFNDENIESLQFDKSDLPVDEKEVDMKEERDKKSMEPMHFAVVSSDYFDEDVDKDTVKDTLRAELRNEIEETVYRGEFSYPFSYQPAEREEPVRIGREYITFNRIMIPESPQEDMG